MSEAAARVLRSVRTTTRVRYPETDRMGIAHHTHFFTWFELGRTELMREAGCAYGELEDKDRVFFPVIEAGASFKSPARYDEVLSIETRLVRADGVRVRFEYAITRPEGGDLVATGFTEHASCGEGGKPIRIPESLRRALAAATVLLLIALGASCSGKKSKGTGELLSAQQALVRVDDAMARHQLRKAKTILSKVQFTTEERAEYEPLVRLALADATYYLGDDLSLIEARSKYLDFVTLYGDHESAPYAQFQAGMCSVKQIYSATRDQAQTQVAIDDFETVNRRWPSSSFARAARQFVGRGRDGLAEHEFIVGSFYRKKKAYDAATERFQGLLEKYPEFRNKDKVYYWLGWTLQKNRNESDARTYLDRVVSEYPNSKYAKKAQEILAEQAKRDLEREGG